MPGVLDWSIGIYNPRVDVTTKTLYASDRDVFLFLVDDLRGMVGDIPFQVLLDTPENAPKVGAFH